MSDAYNNGILFVCLGNICRSPTVEAVTRAEFQRAGLNVPVASCGTGDWHIGQGADPRAVSAGAHDGYDLSTHRARQLVPADFARYRWVLGMDRCNLHDMQRLCPAEEHDRLGLFLEVTGVAPPSEVPDPYKGGDADFAHVLELARRGARALVDVVRAPAQ